MILTKIADVWGPIKTGFEDSLGLSADAIHIHVGVALLLFFAWVTRRPLHDWRPWLMVFVVELANEIIDMNQKAGSIENNWHASRHDLLNTMFIPTLLVLYYGFMRWQQHTATAAQAMEIPAE
ncbi:MAG: hypothetical protein JJE34_02460 [Alphaproteobacteria bacterium]|nr:hypothetical protein [Alphaproteobacteria bacterium]